MTNQIPVPLPTAPPPSFKWASGLAPRSALLEVEQVSFALVRCSQPEARGLVPEAVAQRLCVLPLAVVVYGDGTRSLIVCSGDEMPEQVILQELRFISECAIEFEKAAPEIVRRAIAHAYRTSEAALFRAFEKAASATLNLGSAVGDRDAIPHLVDLILDRALALRASDIHLEYSKLGVSLRYRVDGVLQPHASGGVSLELIQKVVRCLKVRAGLDITIEHQPQEGAFIVPDRKCSVRTSILPVIGGEKIVLRLFSSDGSGLERGLSLGELGLPDEQLKVIRAMLHQASGVVLLSGPTGSGKSTLLRAVLQELKHQSKNIVAIEDPVEQLVPHVSHIEVNRERGLDYPNLLAPVLRQDPDVIVIGEIRDAETAEMVLTAGITGHLVISTVHAGTSLDVLLRLRQFGLSWDLIALSVRLVSSQRLIGRVCSRCSTTAYVTPEFYTTLSLSVEHAFLDGAGCEQCLETGIFGRIGLFELLPITNTIRSQLLSESSESERLGRIYQTAKRVGYEPLPYAIRRALLQQIISPRGALIALGLNPAGLL